MKNSLTLLIFVICSIVALILSLWSDTDPIVYYLSVALGTIGFVGSIGYSFVNWSWSK